MSKDDEIKLLKKAVAAQAKMILNYRTGKVEMEESVFDAMDRVREHYGQDLTKIK